MSGTIEDFSNIESENKKLISSTLQPGMQIFNMSTICGICKTKPWFKKLGNCSYCGISYCSSHSGGISTSKEPQLFSKDGIHEEKNPTCCCICKQLNILKSKMFGSIFIIGLVGAGKTCNQDSIKLCSI
jgi:hypothetical protein